MRKKCDSPKKVSQVRNGREAFEFRFALSVFVAVHGFVFVCVCGLSRVVYSYRWSVFFPKKNCSVINDRVDEFFVKSIIKYVCFHVDDLCIFFIGDEDGCKTFFPPSARRSFHIERLPSMFYKITRVTPNMKTLCSLVCLLSHLTMCHFTTTGNFFYIKYFIFFIEGINNSYKTFLESTEYFILYQEMF